MAQQSARSRDRRCRDSGPCSGCSTRDGWGWASVKAFVWLIFIIFILGYLPDRAYYLTVGRTVDLGVLVWSPINLCPPTNETLPCPAPVGARRSRGSTSPAELALPGAADRRLGPPGRDADPVHRRHRRDDRAVRRSTSRRRSGPATSTSGPRARRSPSRGPTRASPTSPAASTSSAASTPPARRPTTVFVLSPDSQTGALGAVDDRRRPQPARGRAAAPRPRSPPTASCSSAAGTPPGRSTRPCKTRARLEGHARGVVGGAAARSRRRPTRRPSLVGDYLWLYGGSDANGPTGTVQRGAFGQAAAAGLPAEPERGQAHPLGRQQPRPTCRSPGRTRRAGAPTARSTSPAATTASGPQTELYWAVPTNDRRHPRVEAPGRQRPAGVGLEGAPGRRQRPEGDPRRRHDRRRRRPRHERPGEHRAAGAVLPARPGRRDRPGAQDRRRDRPAARLSQRGRRRHRRLHPADPDRLGVRPQGADPGAHRRGIVRPRAAGR